MSVKLKGKGVTRRPSGKCGYRDVKIREVADGYTVSSLKNGNIIVFKENPLLIR
jgi:hypothetical protein